MYAKLCDLFLKKAFSVSISFNYRFHNNVFKYVQVDYLPWLEPWLYYCIEEVRTVPLARRVLPCYTVQNWLWKTCQLLKVGNWFAEILPATHVLSVYFLWKLPLMCQSFTYVYSSKFRECSISKILSNFSIVKHVHIMLE